MIVGLISDTHGRLDPAVIKELEGVDHIIHAGDIGSPQILETLRALAPVTAVRGNSDMGDWALSLPTEAELDIAGMRVLVGHIAGRLRDTLKRQRRRRPSIRVVVSGHTHRVESEERDGVLFVNPGSAGQERFGHPRTMARLTIDWTQDGPEETGASSAEPTMVPRIDVEFLVLPSL